MRLQESQLHRIRQTKKESPLSALVNSIGGSIRLLGADEQCLSDEQAIKLPGAGLSLAVPAGTSSSKAVELRTIVASMLDSSEQLIAAHESLAVRDKTLHQICEVMASYSTERKYKIDFIEALGIDVKYALFYEKTLVFNEGFTSQALDMCINRLSSNSDTSVRILDGQLFVYFYEPYGIAVETRQPLPEAIKHLIQLYVRERGHRERTERSRIVEKKVSQMEWLANHDPLTGLANRRLLTKVVASLIAAETDVSNCHVVLLLDLDGFKQVNDNYGHPIGDQLLTHVAESLEKVCMPQDLVARTGGDEFVVLRPHAITETQITDLANGIIEAVSLPTIISGNRCHISVSIGIAWWRSALDKNNKSVDQWMQEADTALYESKNSGKACYRVAS